VATPGRDHLNIAIQSNQPGRRSNFAEFQILFVGNLIERKGLHWLLEALGDLDRDGWHLHVIGRADLETDYARQIQKSMVGAPFKGRVTYHGPVEREALSLHYDGADLLAVPSNHEGFGLVYLEAMGHGLPVLASASGGASDLVSHGQNGFLIEPGDVGQLRRYLQQYLDDDTLLKRHGKAARDRFSHQPTWAETSQVIIDYLQRNFFG
jgi:glycosyltransferase involved in cell wall biosynthesis